MNQLNKDFKSTSNTRWSKCIMLQIILISSVFYTAQSQPAFTAAHCFSLGDSTGIGTGLSLTPFDTILSQTGSNYVWDYSANNSGGPWYSWTSPVNPYVFEPGANATQITFNPFPIYENPGSTASAYHRAFTYSSDQDTLYELAFSSGGGSNVYVLTPPLPYLSFPLNFQDQGAANITNLLFGSPSSTSRRTWKYDGFGKIIMPYGVMDSVYRIYTVQVDSILSFTSVTKSRELIWFEKSSGIPVLRFIEQGNSFVALYTAAQSSMNINERASINQISPYPNPCREQLHFSCEFDNNRYFIYDMQGRKLLEGRTIKGLNSVHLDGLARGTYILQIGSISKRFIAD